MKTCTKDADVHGADFESFKVGQTTLSRYLTQEEADGGTRVGQTTLSRYLTQEEADGGTSTSVSAASAA